MTLDPRSAVDVDQGRDGAHHLSVDVGGNSSLGSGDQSSCEAPTYRVAATENLSTSSAAGVSPRFDDDQASSADVGGTPSPGGGDHWGPDDQTLLVATTGTFEPMEPYRLRMASDNLDDVERARIGTENRLRARLLQLAVIDAGDKRDLVDVANEIVEAKTLDKQTTDELRRASDVVILARKMEADATKALEAAMKVHPLGPWMAAAKGVGLKQGGRLLAAIGDPYLRLVIDERGPDKLPTAWHYEPRRGPAQLWAYCGYAVTKIPASTDQGPCDPQSRPVGAGGSSPVDVDRCTDDAHTRRVGVNGTPSGSGDQGARIVQSAFVAAAGPSPAPHSDHGPRDDQSTTVGVAVRRVRGQRDNWSAIAKSRAFLIAEATIKVRCIDCSSYFKMEKALAGGKSLPWRPPPAGCTCSTTHPYRAKYDQGRAKYAGAVHAVDCVRCGPQGKPAPAGSPLSDKHQHVRALRLVSKEVLKDLWRQARDWHLAQQGPPTIRAAMPSVHSSEPPAAA